MAENNGSLAEVQLTVAVDKKKYFNQLKKMFQDSQTECDNNKLTVTFQSDRASIENIIKQLDNYDFSANVTLESNVAELKGHLEDVLAHMDMSVPVTADTSALDKKLAEEESKLEELKKKQRKSVAELAKELDTLASKTTDKNFDKNAKEALRLYNALKAAGGNIRSVKDQKVRDFITEAQGYAEYVEFAKQNPIKFVDEAEIQAQIKVIEDLKQEIEKTKQVARDAGAQGTGTGGGASAKVGTEPDVNAEEFAKKVTEQLTVPAKIEVTGTVSDPEKFAEEISNKLTVPTDISVEPVVSSEEFASKLTGQLTVPPQIEVTGVVSDPQKFADDISKQLTVPVNVEVKVSDQVPSSADSNNGNDLEIDPRLKEKVNQYQRAIENLKKYVELQKEAKKANYFILPEKGERSVYVRGNDIHRNGVPYNKVVKERLNNYLHYNTDNDFDTLAAYVYALKDAEKAEAIFGKKHADLFKQVMAYIEQAKLSLKAYNSAKVSFNAGLFNLREVGLDRITYGQADKLESLLKNDGVEAAIEYLKTELGLEIPQAVEATTSAITESAKETSKETQKASEKIDDEGQSAKDAAKWKEEFAKANKAVAESAEETAEKAEKAAEEVEAEGNSAKKAAEEVKAFAENADLLKYLSDIQQGTNTIQFGIQIDKEMAEAELKKIAPEIADSFNKQYGTSITPSQVVKAYKASLKERQAAEKEALKKQQEAEEKALQDHLEYLEKQAQADDDVFREQIQKYKDYIQQTAEKRKEVEDLRQLKAYDDSMVYADQQAADEAEYRRLRKLYEDQDKQQREEYLQQAKDIAKTFDEGDEQKRADLEASYKKSRDILDEIHQLRIANLALDKNDIVESKQYQENCQEILKLYQKMYQEFDSRSKNTFNSSDREEELQAYRQELNVKLQDVKAEKALEQAKADATQHNKDAAKAYDDLFKSAKKYYALLLKRESVGLSDNESKELDKLESKWADAADAVGKYSIEMDGTSDSINRVTAAQERFNNEAQNASLSSISKDLQSSYDKISTMMGSGKYTTAFVSELSNVQRMIRETLDSPLDLNDANIRAKLVSLQSMIDKTIGQKAFSDVKKAASSSLSKLELQIDQFTSQNTGMGLKFKQQFEGLRIRLTDAKSIADVEQLAGAITKLKSQVESAGQATRSFFDILRERIVGVNAQAIAQYFSWQDWIRYIRQMATTVKELDTALTEMRKVSDDSLSSLKAYQKATFDIADAVGTTALALQQSTADWMRLGEAQEEAAKSAQAATVLLNVSEFESIDEATQSLVAVSQAYKDLDKMDIIDVINNIGNNYSVATNELAEGLKNSAAILMTQGNDLNEAVALLTAGNAITQDISKTSTGIRTIALRIAGTKEAKDQLAELGEEVDDFIVQTESKTQKLIKDYTAVASNAYQGVDVLDANGNLRNTYDILLDIAKVYKEIQEEDKKAGTNRAQALVEYIAGKNRSNIAASMLLNPEMLENVYNSAMDSAGSAERELSKYLESIEGHIARFQTQLQELEFDVLDSGAVKEFINLGTGALSVIDSLIDNLGVLGTLGTAAAIAAATKNFGVFRTTLDETSKSGLKITSVFNDLATALSNSKQFAFSAEYTQNISAAKDAFASYNHEVESAVDPQIAYNHVLETGNEALVEYTTQYGMSKKTQDDFINSQTKAQVALMAENTSLTNISSLIQGYNNSTQAAGLSQEEFAAAIMSTNSTLGQYLIRLNRAEASMGGYLAYVIKTTAATIALRAVSMALNAVIGMAVSWLISKAIQAWDDYIHRVDNAKAALEEFEDKCNGLQSDLKKQRDTIDNLSDSYFELAKGVDSVTGKNISLSNSDYESFLQTNKELADAFPELVKYTDEYGNKFLDLGNNVEFATKKLEELYQQNQKDYQYELYKNLPENFRKEKIVMGVIQEQLDAIEAKRKRVNSSIEQLKNLSLDFSVGDMIKVETDYADEEGKEYATAFWNAYAEAINNASDNPQMRQRLQDALLDYSTDSNFNFAINLTSLEDDDRKYLEEQFNGFKDAYAEKLNRTANDIQEDLEAKQKEFESEWQRILPSFVGSAKYLSNDEETGALAAKFVGSLSSEIYDEIKDKPIDDIVKDWVSDISSLSAEDRIKFEDILDPTLTPTKRIKLWNELQANLPESLKVAIQYTIDEDKDILKRVDQSKHDLATITTNGATYTSGAILNDLDNFFVEEQIDTFEEYEKWLEAVAKAGGDAAKAMKLYREEAEKIPETKADSNLVDIATTLNTKVKPAVDSLGKLYQSMFYGKDNKFDASKLAPDELADIKENFITNLTDLKVPLEDAKEKVNEFFTVLSDPNVDEKKAHAAFNKLLSEYFYAAGGLDDLNEKTADGLKKMLKALDVTNADEVVDNAIKDMSKINDVLKAASQIDFDSRIKDAKANLDNEIEKISEFFEDKEPEDIERLTKEITSGAVQSKFGNVDMDKRTVIHWSNEIKKTWEDELKSWGYDPEVGDIDTVRGESSAFFLGEKEVEVAFTPIMVDKDGKNPQYLSQGTVDGYIQSILDEADKEVKKSGKQYSEEAVIEKAIELDFKGKTVDKIDSEGKKVGQQFVHGLIAGIGDDAIDIGSLLHFAGDYGAWELGQKKLEAYKSLKEKAAKGTLDLTNLTAAEIEVLKDEGYATEAVAKQMALLAMQKQLTGETKISTSQQVQALYDLGIQAGMTAAELAVLNDIMRDLDMADNVEKYDTKAAEAIRTRAQAKLDTFKERVQETLNSTLIYGPANTETAKGAGKDAGDAYVEAFEKELKELEEQRDAGVISEKQFLEKYKALIEKYFKDVDGYGEEYAKRMGDYFQRAISYYESIFSAVGTLLDKRISAAQKSKDAAVDALNAEKEAALAAYDAQLEALDELIDAKQKEIDKLREEHEERQRNIDLQKAQYELQKAQNQRTKLIYKDGQMVYENDTTAVRDAKENVENAEYEIAIAKLEKEKELLEEQREAIEKAREAAEKYYDKLISDTEKYWDTIIDALEKQKSKWDELSSIKEIADAYALIQEAGEELGYSVEDILNDVPGAFEAFRDAYINVLKEANSENKNFLDGLANATGTAKDSVNSALGEIGGKASEVSKALEPLGDVSSKLGDTANSLSGIADNSGTAASNVGNLSSSLTEAGKSAEDVSKIENSIKSIAGASLDGTVEAFKNLASHLRDCASALGIGDGEISALESAVDKLSQINLGDDNTGAIGAFNSLASAVGNVTSAIGAVAGGGMADATQSQTGGVPVSGGTGGLIGAIEGVKDAAEKNIGTSSSAGQDVGEDAGNTTGEGGGTAIADFDALYGAVGNVVKAIGDPETEYAEEGTSLVNAIKGLPLIGETALRGEGGIIKMFEDLLEVLEQCVEKADDLLRSINAFKSSGGYSLLKEHTGNVHVGFSTGNVHGNAYASGKLGLKSSENALVGEIGQELVYNPASGTYRTVGDHGPEITRLQKGDLIFNAEQTKAIIKHGKHGGNSYANGSGLMPLSNAEVNMFKTMGNALVGIKADTSQMLEPIKSIAQNINKVTTNNISPTINISGTSFNVSGVTGEAVAAQIRDVFSNLIGNAYQRATKM